jgi:hypothetical protein
MRPRILGAVVCAALLIATQAGVHAYNLTGYRWATGNVVMHLQLGSSSGALLDGSADWNASAESALGLWNQVWNGVSFQAVRNSTADIANPNGINNVSFDDDVFGEPFGEETLAIAQYWYRPSDNRFTEADVVFNAAFSWNSYRGNLRNASGGGRLWDLHRVALHEFGHVLGLNHPDDAGQSVTAIMNSRISNTDSLQSDDIGGVRAIYGAVPVLADRLNAGSQMRPGDALTSGNRRYRLVFQDDGNLVLYDEVERAPLWATDTGGASGGFASMQGDGNFVVYDGQGVPRWASDTGGGTAAFLVVQDDGNLVMYRDGAAIWDRHR